MTYLFTNNQEIKNDIGNPIPISKDLTVNSDANPIYVTGTSDTSFFDPMQSDAFGRLRVSNSMTLFDSFHRYSDNGKIAEYTSGTASSVHNANSSSILITIGSASGDKLYRESTRNFAYQPGKSLQIMTTFCMDVGKPNLRQRIGYFDSADGVYLERYGSQVSLVLRSSSSGVMVEKRKLQADWNVDTLPELNLDRVQIFFMDIEWLGVGSVRCGFVIDGVFRHCHTFHHANTEISAGVPLATTYMGTGCLPIRNEVENTGATTGPSTFRIICSTVISEGGYTLQGRPRCVGHGISTPATLTNDLSAKPIISMRLKANRLGAVVVPTTFTITPVQSAVYKYSIYVKAITSGGTWVSAGADSCVEYNLNPTSLSSGDISSVAFINATNQATGAIASAPLPFHYQLERNSFTSTAYEVVIAVAANANNTTCYGSINWEEIT